MIYDNRFISSIYSEMEMPINFKLDNKQDKKTIKSKLSWAFLIVCFVAFLIPFLAGHIYRTTGTFETTKIINSSSTAGVVNSPELKPEKTAAPVTIIREKQPYVFGEFKPKTNKEKRTVDYIKRFYKTAQAEAEKYGQPASVKLAQAIHESNAGDSRLSKENNNHFGMKCFSKTCSKGHCSNYKDDSHKDFFRIYKSAWYSYRDHSKKVGKNGRYKTCHNLSPENWCDCLKRKGYATNPKYAELLKKTIVKYGLKEFD